MHFFFECSISLQNKGILWKGWHVKISWVACSHLHGTFICSGSRLTCNSYLILQRPLPQWELGDRSHQAVKQWGPDFIKWHWRITMRFVIRLASEDRKQRKEHIWDFNLCVPCSSHMVMLSPEKFLIVSLRWYLQLFSCCGLISWKTFPRMNVSKEEKWE